jgi:hypothetical protein
MAASPMIDDEADRQNAPTALRLYVPQWKKCLSRQPFENKGSKKRFFSSQSRYLPEEKATYNQPVKS